MFTSDAGNQYWRNEKRSRKGPSRNVVCTIYDTPRNMKTMSKTLSLSLNENQSHLFEDGHIALEEAGCIIED